MSLIELSKPRTKKELIDRLQKTEVTAIEVVSATDPNYQHLRLIKQKTFSSAPDNKVEVILVKLK